jgi:excisionase family DNA binding protein
MAARKKPPDPEAEIMTVREVADYLRISISTVYRLANRHELPGFKVGDWRFHRRTLDDWVRQRATMTQAKRT